MSDAENGSNTTSEADKWRLRERSILVGLVFWAFVVGMLATHTPKMVAEWITSYSALAVAGIISISVGLSAGAVESFLLALSRWKERSNDELTVVPWEEDNEQ